jgi:hypothetical protein
MMALGGNLNIGIILFSHTGHTRQVGEVNLTHISSGAPGEQLKLWPICHKGVKIKGADCWGCPGTLVFPQAQEQ